MNNNTNQTEFEIKIEFLRKHFGINFDEMIQKAMADTHSIEEATNKLYKEIEDNQINAKDNILPLPRSECGVNGKPIDKTEEASIKIIQKHNGRYDVVATIDHIGVIYFDNQEWWFYMIDNAWALSNSDMQQIARFMAKLSRKSKIITNTETPKGNDDDNK